MSEGDPQFHQPVYRVIPGSYKPEIITVSQEQRDWMKEKMHMQPDREAVRDQFRSTYGVPNTVEDRGATIHNGLTAPIVIRFQVVDPEKPYYNPVRANISDAGYDLAASQECVIAPFSFYDVPTNIRAIIPDQYWGMICARSSAWFKKHLFVYSGKIDPGYRGELLYGVFNPTNQPVVIAQGERVAQFILVPNVNTYWVPFDGAMPSTDRGERGFGSSGGFTESQSGGDPFHNPPFVINGKVTEMGVRHIQNGGHLYDNPAVFRIAPDAPAVPETNWGPEIDEVYQATTASAFVENMMTENLAQAQDYRDHGEQLRHWLHDTIENDFERVGPKIVEYGNGNSKSDDLITFGTMLGSVATKVPPELYKEFTAAVYMMGKVCRAFAAYGEGKSPSEDTLHDITMYALIIRRIRDTGQWP